MYKQPKLEQTEINEWNNDPIKEAEYQLCIKTRNIIYGLIFERNWNINNLVEKIFLIREKEKLEINEIFNDPMGWWQKDATQKARSDFCDRYAYATKDWRTAWVREFDRFKTVL